MCHALVEEITNIQHCDWQPDSHISDALSRYLASTFVQTINGTMIYGICVKGIWNMVIGFVANCIYGITRYPLYSVEYCSIFLAHWGQVTHICVGNLTIIGLDNGLSPGRRQAII